MEGAPMSGSFFTRTLGEAQLFNAGRPHPFPTVPRLLDHQSTVAADRIALGLFLEMPRNPHEAGPKYKIYSFLELRLAAVDTAESLRSHWVFDKEERVIALMGRSTRPFFYAWLGLVYLGYSVLLLSPDLSPNAVAHLCKECSATKLLYDPARQDLAESAQAACCHTLNIYSLPSPAAFQSHGSSCRSVDIAHTWPVSELDIAYYHHTSGTSGGLPKLLPVTHKMAIGVLPHETWQPSAEATFSTTPIYHGGVADCFRSWSATTQIWLHPGEIAMTARILQQCVDAARNAYLNGLAYQLTYISCVPVVLSQLAESFEGVTILKSMRMVGVGGAAMPEQVAKRLVDEGVNLISRYGTTECGFLLSSHRSFEIDKDWQFLRHDPRITAIQFERRTGGVFEMVVGPTWPALLKSTREDGSFATKDLFKPHPSIPNAWRYHSRADAQITLSTGKKFDPTPSEDSIRQSDLLEDILIFGDNHTFPGALLFRSPRAASIEGDEVLDQVWLTVHENNAQCPKHAKLHKSMLVVMSSTSSGLPKSSKGTTLRKQAVERYKTDIENAYATERFRTESPPNGNEGFSGLDLHENEVIAIISNIVRNAKEDLDHIELEDDFFNHGIDSTDCVRIREKIQARLIPPHCPKLPLDVVYDTGNITNLSNFVINFRKGVASSPDDELQLMGDLVAEYGNWQTQNSDIFKNSHIPTARDNLGGKEVVLITGVTGTLGAHVLSQLCTQSSIGEIHCLVRGTNVTAARERVRKSLLHRQLPPLDASTIEIHHHPCNLSQKDLGLSEKTFSDLAHRVTLIIHAAWAVNFSTRLPSFVKDNIAGLHNLIRFTTTSRRSAPPHFVFCSSTASATASNHNSCIPESIINDPRASSPLGYSRSKWVAEQICDQAHRKTYLQNNISVLRIGQLCGDTKNGVWNVKEAWPLMLSSSTVTGSLPDLGQEPLNWLPVDKAAQALLEIAAASKFQDAVGQHLDPAAEHANAPTVHPCRVYNIVNPSTERTWVDMLGWLKRVYPTLEVLSPAAWLARLEGLEGEAANHPSRALLGFWRGIYGIDNTDKPPQRTSYDMAQTRKVAPVMRDIDAIDEEHFLKMWAWIRSKMADEI